MTPSVVRNETGGAVIVLESIPVGLASEDQNSRHTNLVGRLIEGCITVGETVTVPMRGGSRQSVQLIGITVSADCAKQNGISTFPQSLRVEAGHELNVALSVRIPPENASNIET